MILYHGTTLINLFKIIESNEIIPQGSLGSDALNLDGNPHYNPKSYLGYSFFTDDIFRAVDYCTIAMSNVGDYTTGNTLVILELDLPENILLPDYCDFPLGVSWQDSLLKINQVSIKGNIDLSYLSRILFVDYEEPDVIIESAVIDNLYFVLDKLNIIIK